MRVIVTGSRDWAYPKAIEHELDALADASTVLTVVHGACPTGADAMASDWCHQRRPWFSNYGRIIVEERHPAQWDRFGKGAGPLRNIAMVDLGADLVLAFPVAGSKGTAHCIAYAHEIGIPVKNLGRS